MASGPLTHNDYTVGWVCALPKELIAAMAMLDEIHTDLPKPLNDHNAYTLGRVGEHNVVIACLPKGEIGNNSSATVATRMTSTFPSIKFGVMVGVGGGVPKFVRLGDVVASTPTDGFGGVVQWDFGKTEQGGTFKRTGALNSPPGALLTALTKLEAEHAMKGSKIPQYLEDLKTNWPKLAPKYIRSESLEDILFRADYHHVEKSAIGDMDTPDNAGEEGEEEEEEENYCTNCDRSKIIQRKARDMHVHYGLIASGNQVIKDATFRDEINRRLGGKVLCFEMEAAGLMNDFPCIVIRGICDYADSHKNKGWQEHAAAVAAAFAKEFLSVVPTQEVGQMPTIKIPEDVHNCITQISNGVDNLVQRQNDQEHQAILDWLTLINYDPQQSDFIRRRQEGTGKWLLKSTEFQSWVNQNKQTLFCPGIPGAGKTIITSIVVDDLHRRFQKDVRVGIAYLYCDFRRKQEQTPENLLASLLKQLAQQQRSVPESVKRLHKDHKSKKTRPSIDEISMVLHSVVADYSRAFIIIDALDECQVSGGARAKFLSEIFKLQDKSCASIFATSRFIPDVKGEFERRKSILLEIRASNEDVRRYLDGHRSKLPNFVLKSPDLEEEVKTSIVKAVDGMFLLARLHLDSLEDKISRAAIKYAIEKFPKGSDAYNQAYQEAMKRIQDQKSGFRNLAMQVLCWIICARRPLAPSELQHAIAVTIGAPALNNDNLTEVELMVSVCAGLVTVDEESDIIRLVHYTTQEYFERTRAFWFPDAQRDIATNCITYLLFDIFETGFCPTDEEFEARLQAYVLYDYAARNWGHHAREASAEVNELILNLLMSEAKVSGCSQAMMASRQLSWMSGYSQKVPQRMTGVHLAAYFGLKEAITALLKNGRDPDSKDTSGRTPMHDAAQNGYGALVKLLLEKGAELESKDNEYGLTPLSLAAQNGHGAVVKLLLEKGAELESEDNQYGLTPLSWAAVYGHEELVKLLLEKGAELESESSNGQTPLSQAAENGREVVVKLLLEKGAELESEDNKYGLTPLSWAAGNGHEEVVKLLLEKGAELESQSSDGQTPLSRAAANGHEVIVKLLLEKGAELESQSSNGRTPLSWAAMPGHEAVVKLLLEKGAELESKDNNCDCTPLLWAARNGWEAVVKLLLEEGAELESAFSNGQTPLSCAAENGHEVIVRLLLEKGAELESQSSNGRTPLSWAAENGHEATVKALLDKGAGLESEDEYGFTPLLWAAQNGHEAVMKLLLKKGAELDSNNEYGQALLSWTAESDHEAVVKLLLEKATELESKEKEHGEMPLSWAVESGREVVVKLVLEKGAELESKNEYGQTPLAWAAGSGCEAVVELLLATGRVEADSRDKDERTPLSRAAEEGHEAIVKLLLATGNVEADSKDNKERTPLSKATEEGHEAIVKLLLVQRNIEVNSKDNKGRTPLLIAAQRGHEVIVKLLLATGKVEANSKDNKGRTPLLRAAKKGHKTIVKLLLAQSDIDVNLKDNKGRTPLLVAAQRGREAIMRLLLATGKVEVDSKDQGGHTPLLGAAENGHQTIVELLLATGRVEANSKDNKGQTPLLRAIEKGHATIVKLLLATGKVEADSKDNKGQPLLLRAIEMGHATIVKLLPAQSDIDFNSKDNEGQTLLIGAVRRGRKEVVKLMLARTDVRADLGDNHGMTPLAWAALRGYKAIVKLLLERGDVKADSKDIYGRTPLSWSAGWGHAAVVKLLLERSDVEAYSKDNQGRTPLSWAAESGHVAVAKLLLARSDIVPDLEGDSRRVAITGTAEQEHKAVVDLLQARSEVKADAKDSYAQTQLGAAAEHGHDPERDLSLAMQRHMEAQLTQMAQILQSIQIPVPSQMYAQTQVQRQARRDAKACSRDAYGRTPLSWAAEGGHEAVVKLLLARSDVKVNFKDNYGETPLSQAAKRGHQAVVKLLAARSDFDADLKDDDRPKSPLGVRRVNPFMLKINPPNILEARLRREKRLDELG